MKRISLVAVMGLLTLGATGLARAGDWHHGSGSYGYAGYGNFGYPQPYGGYVQNHNFGQHGYGQGAYYAGQNAHGSHHGIYGYNNHQSAGHGIQINAPHFGLRIGH